MALDGSILGAEFAPLPAEWTERDCRIYALGVGAGAGDPLAELAFTTENSAGVAQRVLPTFGVIEGGRAGIKGMLEALDLGLEGMLHGDQKIVLHKPLPLHASVETRARVIAVWDKGSATVVTTEAVTAERGSNEPLFTCSQSLFFRGQGGWGGERGPASAAEAPDRAPDVTASFTTRRDQALIYRLTGDFNPLHSDPTAARQAGFPRPILHGLCGFGIVGRLILNVLCDGDTARFGAIEARFSGVLFPGDAISLSIWREADGATFAAFNQDRQIVMSGGRFAYARP